jgi:molybdenum cofactor biosynthesis enzyme MoaA
MQQISEKYNLTRTIAERKHICHAPFNNIYLNSLGQPAACWQSFFYEPEESYPSKSLHDIWFGEKFTRLRESVRSLDLTFKCSACKKHLEEGNFTNILAKAYDNDYPLSAYPAIMELELSNTCNLECIMCFGDLSSSIRKNREHKPPLQSPYGKKFAQEMEEFIPHLHEVRFNGGESFLISQYYQIWEKIIKIKPTIRCTLATNGTVLNNKIKRLLPKGNFHLNVSLDSLNKKTYEYIRKNAVFEKTMKNLEYFHEFCKKHDRTLCIVTNPMRCNWEEMPQFVEFANKLNVPLWFNTIMRPKELGLWSLSKTELEKIYTALKEHTFVSPGPEEYQKQHNIKIYKNLVEVQIKNWLDEAS